MARTLDKTVNDRKHLSGREFERLRVSEACGLVLEQVDVESRVLHVARLKGGLSTTHPLRGDEIRAIKAWLVERARLKALDHWDDSLGF